MLKKLIKMLLRLLLYACILALVVLGLPRLITAIYASARTETVASVRPARVAIVLGAGLRRDGSPTPILEDRVRTAAELYFSGKVEKLLMSGDNRFLDYNEPGAMHDYAAGLGVPEADIVMDYAGRRTYDTCYRAGYIFGVTDAIIVTQDFHLPRAVFLCNSLGVKAVGVSADRRPYHSRSMLIWTARELAATTGAFWDVLIAHPLPVLGEKEPIFPENAQMEK
jgi:SanA protein